MAGGGFELKRLVPARTGGGDNKGDSSSAILAEGAHGGRRI